MQQTRKFRHFRISALRCGLILAIAGIVAPSACPQAPSAGKPVILDRVIAVVNDRAILNSDLTLEMRVSVLEPNAGEANAETPQAALQRLISRTLIRQQIREEDAQADTPSSEEIAQRLTALRKELPICVRENCESDAGWKAFLTRHDLTQQEVEAYLRNRLGILRFIEVRFRQGIQISPDEIQTYYHHTLVPQYQKDQAIPSLDQVSSRIQEILLQQKVSTMFSGWLDSLRKQGEVEILDPTLEAAATPDSGGTGAP
jgi:peptidyl-prolyl cis-trans isomerase SurA